MRGSVHERHLLLNPLKELIELAIEAIEEEAKCRDRWQRAATFNRAHRRPRQGCTERGLAESRGQSTTAQLVADRRGEARVR
jgi:hypothetical protein